MIYIGIDPGPEKSAVVAIQDGKVYYQGEMDRECLLDYLGATIRNHPPRLGCSGRGDYVTRPSDGAGVV